MINYINVEKAYKDDYWKCVVNAVGLAYPTTFTFTGKFAGLNTSIKNCQTKGFFTFEDVKREEDFRAFANTKTSTGDYSALLEYIWGKKYTNIYWKCVGYAI